MPPTNIGKKMLTEHHFSIANKQSSFKIVLFMC